MGNEALTLGPRKLRTTDSNSLLRMYDYCKGIVHSSTLHQERMRADKAVQRIVKELHQRKISF